MNTLLAAEDSIEQLQARVTQLEQENAALRSSESRYRQCFENAPVSFLFVSATGEAKEMNAAAEKFLGWTIAQAKAAEFNGFTNPILIENGTVNSFQRSLAGETVIEAPMFFDPSSTIGRGQCSWAQGHYYPIRDEAGEVQEIVEIAIDLTAMYEVQQQLAQERIHEVSLKENRAICEKLAAVEAQNQLLANRDRLLEATAKAVNASLTLENFDEAVNSALQILGEASGCDRINILENFFDTAPTKPAYYTVIYEWVREGAVAQISHLKSGSISSQGIEEFMERYFARGDGFGGLIDEWVEPLRSAFKAVEIQSTYSTPIRVNGQWWGVLCFDYCREPIRVSSAEVAVLKTIADCIGSAIGRDRTQKAILQTEQERAAELERINAELQRAIAHLAESEKRYRTLFELSSEGIHRVAFDEPIPVALPVDEQVELCYRYLYIAEANAAFAAMYGHEKPEDIIGLRMTDIHIANSEKNKAFMRAQIESGYRIRNAESEEVDRHGRKLYFLNNTACTIEDGCVTGGWGTQTDITELREAQQTLLSAEQERSAQLSKVNEVLKQTVDVLATETDFDRFLGHVLQVIAVQLDAPLTEYWYHAESDNIAYVGLTYWQGQILKPEEQPGHVGLYGYPVPPELIHQESLHHRRSHITVDDMAINPIHVQIANEYGLDAGAWYESRGVRRVLNVPLILGDRTIGALIVFLPCDRHFTEEDIKLTSALAQQVTLAVQLTRLAEETKQAAIAREQEKAAQERVTQLVKANVTLKKTLDVLATEPELDRALGHVLQVSSEQLESSSSALWLFRPESDRFSIHLVYINGEIIAALPETVDRLNGQWIRDRDLSRDLAFKQHIRDRAPVIYDLENHPESTPLQRRFMQRLGVKTLLGIPLLLGSEIVGSFTIRFSDRREFQAEELELTQALAHQATLAIQLTRLGEQAKGAAILEERNRMARDIHDSLAQSLTGIIMQLQAAGRFLTGKPEQTQACLTRAQDLAKEGLAEARRSVWALFPDGFNSCYFSDVLTRITQQLTADTAIRAEVCIQGVPYSLPPETGTNLLRIAQESLTNALRHAGAETVEIQLVYESDRLYLSVRDDGCGFDPQQQVSGFGLGGMRQRAEQIGAQLEIQSELGAGTKVIIYIAFLSNMRCNPVIGHRA